MDTERITVGIDDSSGSRAALRWTAERAAQSPVSVLLVHVLERRGPHAEPAESLLADARASLLAAAPTSEVETVLDAGGVAEVLTSHTAGSDLLVIGAHRDRILRSALRGWLPERIATVSRVPTVVVADDWERHDGPVLVGVAAGEPAGAAVAFAATEARRSGRHLDVLSAWRLPLPIGGARPVTLAEDPRLFAESATSDVAAAAATARAHVGGATDRTRDLVVEGSVVEGLPAEMLAERSRTAALVVIGRKHRTTVGGALFGSTARGLLHHSRTPICVVPTVSARSAVRAPAM
jgi:nucleotide-binding universal stress UspA family protein